MHACGPKKKCGECLELKLNQSIKNIAYLYRENTVLNKTTVKFCSHFVAV